MFSDDDIQYALQATEVLHEPDRRIDTFGSTQFEFHLLCELMDNANRVRVRSGRIEAERPKIVAPEVYCDMLFEGFGEQAEAFSRWLTKNSVDLAVFKYGFSFKKCDMTEDIVHEPFETVCEKVMEVAKVGTNPMSAVIKGVDDTWEISLLKFTIEMIEKSKDINHFDFKRRRLL